MNKINANVKSSQSVDRVVSQKINRVNQRTLVKTTGPYTTVVGTYVSK